MIIAGRADGSPAISEMPERPILCGVVHSALPNIRRPDPKRQTGDGTPVVFTEWALGILELVIISEGWWDYSLSLLLAHPFSRYLSPFLLLLSFFFFLLFGIYRLRLIKTWGWKDKSINNGINHRRRAPGVALEDPF